MRCQPGVDQGDAGGIDRQEHDNAVHQVIEDGLDWKIRQQRACELPEDVGK